MIYVLDTNVITAVLKNDETIKGKIITVLTKGDGILINGISYYEIKRGLLAANATTQLSRFDQFCSQYGLLFLDNKEIFDEAAEIYANLQKRGKLLEDADILIGASAKVWDFVLVSNDTDFRRIQNLKIEDWAS